MSNQTERIILMRHKTKPPLVVAQENGFVFVTYGGEATLRIGNVLFNRVVEGFKLMGYYRSEL